VATDAGSGFSGGHDETNITFVMVVIIVVFIICELPASANQVGRQHCSVSEYVGIFAAFFLQISQQIIQQCGCG